jgi:hypothetical protein
VKRFAACVVLAAAGCGSPAPPASAPAPEPAGDHGHSHERGKMLIADAGKYHALLTAHLSKDGHELDLFFETAGDKPEPVAIPAESLVAEVQVRSGEGEVRRVEFRPAPPEERPPGEGPDRCSHFVAAVPWLNPDVPHRVTIEVPLDKRKVTARWNDFVPRKYAHHED